MPDHEMQELLKSIDAGESALLKDLIKSVSVALETATEEEAAKHTSAFLLFVRKFIPEALEGADFEMPAADLEKEDEDGWDSHLKAIMADNGHYYFGNLSKHYWGEIGTGPGRMDRRGYGPLGKPNPKKVPHSTKRKQEVHGRGTGARTSIEELVALADTFKVLDGADFAPQAKENFDELDASDKKILEEIYARAQKKNITIPERDEMIEMDQEDLNTLLDDLGIMGETRGGSQNVVDQTADGTKRRRRDISEMASKPERGAGKNLRQGDGSALESALETARGNKKLQEQGKQTEDSYRPDDKRLGVHPSKGEHNKGRRDVEPGKEQYGTQDPNKTRPDQPTMNDLKYKVQEIDQRNKNKAKREISPKQRLADLLAAKGKKPVTPTADAPTKVTEDDLAVAAGPTAAPKNPNKFDGSGLKKPIEMKPVDDKELAELLDPKTPSADKPLKPIDGSGVKLWDKQTGKPKGPETMAEAADGVAADTSQPAKTEKLRVTPKNLRVGDKVSHEAVSGEVYAGEVASVEKTKGYGNMAGYTVALTDGTKIHVTPSQKFDVTRNAQAPGEGPAPKETTLDDAKQKLADAATAATQVPEVEVGSKGTPQQTYKINIPKSLFEEWQYHEVDTLDDDAPQGKKEFVEAWHTAVKTKKYYKMELSPAAAEYLADDTGPAANTADIAMDNLGSAEGIGEVGRIKGIIKSSAGVREKIKQALEANPPQKQQASDGAAAPGVEPPTSLEGLPTETLKIPKKLHEEILNKLDVRHEDEDIPAEEKLISGSLISKIEEARDAKKVAVELTQPELIHLGEELDNLVSGLNFLEGDDKLLDKLATQAMELADDMPDNFEAIKAHLSVTFAEMYAENEHPDTAALRHVFQNPSMYASDEGMQKIKDIYQNADNDITRSNANWVNRYVAAYKEAGDKASSPDKAQAGETPATDKPSPAMDIGAISAPDPSRLQDVMDRIDELFTNEDIVNSPEGLHNEIYKKVYNAVGETKPTDLTQGEYAEQLMGGRSFEEYMQHVKDGGKKLGFTMGGWHHRMGEAGSLDGVDSKDIRRFYLNVKPDNAAQLSTDIQDKLDEAGIKFQYKVLANLKHFDRSDSSVLYIEKGDTEVAAKILADYSAKNPSFFAPDVPKLTKQLAPGISVADEPNQDAFKKRYPIGQVSFGSGNSFLIANALHELVEDNPNATKEDKVQAVRAEYAKLGIDPDRPWLNDGAKTKGPEGGTSQTPAPTKGIIDYDAQNVKLTPTGSAGGSTGAQIATDEQGNKWLLKTYESAGKDRSDRIATELVSNAIYREMGIDVPAMGTITHGGQKAVAYPLLDGKPIVVDGPNADLSKGYMVDALLANHDFLGTGGAEDRNILQTPDGKLVRLDQGGTLDFRAQGKKKDFGPVPKEVESMVLQGQANGVLDASLEDLKAQAGEIVEKLDGPTLRSIFKAVKWDNANHGNDMKARLQDRINWMDDFASGDEDVSDAFKAKLKPSGDQTQAPTGADGDSKVLTAKQYAEKAVEALPEDGDKALLLDVLDNPDSYPLGKRGNILQLATSTPDDNEDELKQVNAAESVLGFLEERDKALGQSPMQGNTAPTAQPNFQMIPDVKLPNEPTAEELKQQAGGKGVSTGMIVVDKDSGKLWIFEPKDGFGGYDATFPKGQLEGGLTPQQNAHKELWEETGLKAKVTDYLGAYDKSTSYSAYYVAERTGGEPIKAGPETASVKEVTFDEAEKLLNTDIDKKILKDLQAKVGEASSAPTNVSAEQISQLKAKAEKATAALTGFKDPLKDALASGEPNDTLTYWATDPAFVETHPPNAAYAEAAKEVVAWLDAKGNVSEPKTDSDDPRQKAKALLDSSDLYSGFEKVANKAYEKGFSALSQEDQEYLSGFVGSYDPSTPDHEQPAFAIAHYLSEAAPETTSPEAPTTAGGVKALGDNFSPDVSSSSGPKTYEELKASINATDLTAAEKAPLINYAGLATSEKGLGEKEVAALKKLFGVSPEHKKHTAILDDILASNKAGTSSPATGNPSIPKDQKPLNAKSKKAVLQSKKAAADAIDKAFAVTGNATIKSHLTKLKESLDDPDAIDRQAIGALLDHNGKTVNAAGKAAADYFNQWNQAGRPSVLPKTKQQLDAEAKEKAKAKGGSASSKFIEGIAGSNTEQKLQQLDEVARAIATATGSEKNRLQLRQRALKNHLIATTDYNKSELDARTKKVQDKARNEAAAAPQKKAMSAEKAKLEKLTKKGLAKKLEATHTEYQNLLNKVAELAPNLQGDLPIEQLNEFDRLETSKKLMAEVLREKHGYTAGQLGTVRRAGKGKAEAPPIDSLKQLTPEEILAADTDDTAIKTFEKSKVAITDKMSAAISSWMGSTSFKPIVAARRKYWDEQGETGLNVIELMDPSRATPSEGMYAQGELDEAKQVWAAAAIQKPLERPVLNVRASGTAQGFAGYSIDELKGMIGSDIIERDPVNGSLFRDGALYFQNLPVHTIQYMPAGDRAVRFRSFKSGFSVEEELLPSIGAVNRVLAVEKNTPDSPYYTPKWPAGSDIVVVQRHAGHFGAADAEALLRGQRKSRLKEVRARLQEIRDRNNGKG